MQITHYDLFAGIGGFSLALEEVFTNATIKHIFCEWESFPTSVLRRHWPDGEFYGDIADLVSATDAQRQRLLQRQAEDPERHAELSDRDRKYQAQKEFTIVTGGFPCQPFSHAGRRKGTADDRYQWPNMFEVIRNIKPNWVVAENVRGLITWNDGMVLEQVCSDLENEGYEVQPLIIPAVAVGAPHRRDRVWITAHRDNERTAPRHSEVQKAHGEIQERYDDAESGDTVTVATADTRPQRRHEGVGEGIRPEGKKPGLSNRQYPDWSRDWKEVAFATCNDTVDDGLSRLVDGVPYSRAKWRKDSLKAYGNGIVPQVAMNIMQAIKASI